MYFYFYFLDVVSNIQSRDSIVAVHCVVAALTLVRFQVTAFKKSSLINSSWNFFRILFLFLFLFLLLLPLDTFLFDTLLLMMKRFF